MAKPTIAEYKCTKQELYSIAETIYNNLSDNLAAFTAYKTKYNAAYVTALRANRTTAKNLPDVEARNTVSETNRLELIPLAQACTDAFQMLKGYINDAFPEEQHSTKYDAAGQTKYAAATRQNWEELSGMNSSMNSFISTNLTVLTTKDFMPAAFPATVTAATSAFETKYSALKLQGKRVRRRQTG